MRKIWTVLMVIVTSVGAGGCAYDNSRFYPSATFVPGSSESLPPSVVSGRAPTALAMCHARRGFIPPGIVIDWMQVGPAFAAMHRCGAPKYGAMWIHVDKVGPRGYSLLLTNDIDGSGAMSTLYLAGLVSEEAVAAGRIARASTDGDPDNRPAPNSGYQYQLDRDETLLINGHAWRHRRWYWEKEGGSSNRTPREEYRMQAAPGWTFLIRFNTSLKKDDHSELLEARRRTLRKMVESVKIERLDMVWAEQELQRQKEAECVRYPKSCRGDKRSQH